jgi:hypothetical protein
MSTFPLADGFSFSSRSRALFTIFSLYSCVYVWRMSGRLASPTKRDHYSARPVFLFHSPPAGSLGVVFFGRPEDLASINVS